MLSYYIVYPLAWLLGLLPYRVQFLFSDVLCLVLYRLIRYRLKTVRTNLAESFPEKSRKELRQIERRFYKHLADVFIETMSLASVRKRQIMRRMYYTNVDQMRPCTEGRSWVCAMAHYGSWEYTTNFAITGAAQDGVLAVYRPLHDRGFDRFFSHIRSRFGVKPVPMNDIGREVVRSRSTNRHVAVALIADQTPPGGAIQNWTMFLGRWTPFFMGMEKLALRLHLPVLFLDVKKVSRGYYEARFELIYDGTEAVPEGEITRRYAERLELMIRHTPELWMWSHRRWKHTRKYPADPAAGTSELLPETSPALLPGGANQSPQDTDK